MYSIVDYTANGSTVDYAVPFPYLAKSHVEVYVDGTLKLLTTDYTWSNDGQITFNSAPTTGLAIRIKRNTPRAEAEVDFTNGSKLTETDLDTSQAQLLYIIQEMYDALSEAILDAPTGTLPAPEDPGDNNKVLVANSGEAEWRSSVLLAQVTTAALRSSGNSSFGGLLRPLTDGAPDIGTSSFRFKDLYLSGALHIGGQDQANITVVTAVRWDTTEGKLQVKTRQLKAVPAASESEWTDISASYSEIEV